MIKTKLAILATAAALLIAASQPGLSVTRSHHARDQSLVHTEQDWGIPGHRVSSPFDASDAYAWSPRYRSETAPIYQEDGRDRW